MMTTAQYDRAVICSPDRPLESGRSGATRAQLKIESVGTYFRPCDRPDRPVVACRQVCGVTATRTNGGPARQAIGHPIAHRPRTCL